MNDSHVDENEERVVTLFVKYGFGHRFLFKLY